jgi:ABC-type polysaccharide/polyol phosphate export permease
MVDDPPSLPAMRTMGSRRNSLLSIFYQIKQLSSSRDLLSQLTKREIAARYRQSALGLSWSVIEPILLAMTYYFLFVMLRGNTDKMYAVWILLGVLIWACFAKTLMGVVTSLSHNASTIQAVYFARVIHPCVKMLSNIRITLLSCLVVIPIMIIGDLPFTIHLVWVFAAILMSGLLGFGFGMIFAPMNCSNRDLEHLFRFVTRAGFFLSPVMWTIDMALERGKLGEMVLLNPMATPLTLVRDGVSGNAPSIDLIWIAYSCGFIILSWVVGAYFFEKNQAEAVKYL